MTSEPLDGFEQIGLCFIESDPDHNVANEGRIGVHLSGPILGIQIGPQIVARHGPFGGSFYFKSAFCRHAPGFLPLLDRLVRNAHA